MAAECGELPEEVQGGVNRRVVVGGEYVGGVVYVGAFVEFRGAEGGAMRRCGLP
jgi:hypothetical protein